jgi:uncharacterized protein YkwD
MKPHFSDYLHSFVLATIVGLTIAHTAHAESIPTDRQQNLPSASSLTKEFPRLALETSSTTDWDNSGGQAKPRSTPAKTSAPTPAPTPATPGTQAYNSISPSSISNPVLNSLNAAVLRQVNEYRQAHNLAPLTIDPAISAVAQAHSESMASEGGITHDGFNQRVDAISKTIVYRSAAENVGYNMGYAKPDAIVIQDWIDSPGHHKNMVGRFDLTGIGVAKNARGEYYFTQIFIRKAFYTKDAD